MRKFLRQHLRGMRKALIGYFLGGLGLTVFLQFLLYQGYENKESNSPIALFVLLLGLAVFVAFAAYCVRVFRDDLESDHAYLVLSLPQRMWQMIASRLLVIYLWSQLFVLSFFLVNAFFARILFFAGKGAAFPASVYIRGGGLWQDALKSSLSLFVPLAILAVFYFSVILTNVLGREKGRKALGLFLCCLLLFLYLEGRALLHAPLLLWMSSGEGGGTGAALSSIETAGFLRDTRPFPIFFYDLSMIFFSVFVGGRLLDRRAQK